MPVLTHHELDAGPYLSCAITVTKDPARLAVEAALGHSL